MSAKRDDRVDHRAELDPQTAQSLQTALKAAVDPQALDAGRHAEILARALEDPWASPTETERADAERLHEALAGHGEHPSARIYSALRAAYSPTPASGSRIRQLAMAALRRRRMGRVVALSAAPAATLALAAGLAFLLTRPSPLELPPNRPGVVASRSTSSLFHGKFQLAGTSARLDTIVAVRARDLRKNRYSRWGLE
jgi:hypothetical protein